LHRLLQLLALSARNCSFSGTSCGCAMGSSSCTNGPRKSSIVFANLVAAEGYRWPTPAHRRGLAQPHVQARELDHEQPAAVTVLLPLDGRAAEIQLDREIFLLDELSG